MSGCPKLVLAGSPLLSYMPIVDLASGELLGFEASASWEHPVHGHIPAEWLSAWAAANGGEEALAAWAMREACIQAQLWSTRLQLGLQCSRSLLRAGVASRCMRSALEASEVNPDRITLEVVESSITDGGSSGDLSEITGMGVHLSIDEVGTSWASMDTMCRHKIDTVKIGSGFISRLESDQGVTRCIIEAVIDLSHGMGASTLAEGVQSHEQALTLQSLGADAAQGTFFSPVLSADEAERLGGRTPVARFSLRHGTEAEDSQEPSQISLVAAHQARSPGKAACMSYAMGPEAVAALWHSTDSPCSQESHTLADGWPPRQRNEFYRPKLRLIK